MTDEHEVLNRLSRQQLAAAVRDFRAEGLIPCCVCETPT
jgi:hypothetical protein